MNGYDRYHGMITGQPAKAVPCSPILMQFAADEIGIGDALAS